MSMNQGDIVPVESSPGRRRVVVALNWDAQQHHAGFLEKLKGSATGQNVETFDLDISCVMYGADGEFLDGVSGRPEEMADQSGKVYHSGDDTTGSGDLDDEYISVELADMPDDVHHIIFVVEVQSKHTFADVGEPRVHLADTKSGAIQHQVDLSGPYTAFIYGRIFRDGADWKFHYIGEYALGAQIADWVAALQPYAEA